jgi:hypothetical protein
MIQSIYNLARYAKVPNIDISEKNTEETGGIQDTTSNNSGLLKFLQFQCFLRGVQNHRVGQQPYS